MKQKFLILPGWQNSGPQHWQSFWEQMPGFERVEQHDWAYPLRGDWIARLEDVLLQSPHPAVLVAHSLACVLVAAWAAHSSNTALVKAAFLVAPADTHCARLHTLLPLSWAAIPTQRLPFPSAVVASHDDHYCRFERAQTFARAWGSDLVDAGAQGHLNADSKLDDWPQGQAWLAQLLARCQTPTPCAAAL
jgi:predicted alpha/beta hydrolase family esterase